jgi:hypothetical protein
MIAHKSASNSRIDFETAMEKPQELVREHPMAAAMIVFGVGLGVGLLLSQAACGQLSYFTHHEPTMAEKLTNRVREAILPMLPESLGRGFAG